jgi:hypothetical protein
LVLCILIGMEFFWSLVTNNHPSKVGPGRMIPHRRSWDMLKISSSSSPLGFWYSLVHHRRAVLRLTLNHYHACTMVLSTSHPLQSVSFPLPNCSTFASVVTRKVQSRGKQKLVCVHFAKSRWKIIVASFVVICQNLSNHRLTRLKRFVPIFTDKLCN